MCGCGDDNEGSTHVVVLCCCVVPGNFFKLLRIHHPSHGHSITNSDCSICLGELFNTVDTSSATTTSIEAEAEDATISRKDGHVVVLLRCGHGFHEPCIEQWFRHSTVCPNCRNTASTTTMTDPLIDRTRGMHTISLW